MPCASGIRGDAVCVMLACGDEPGKTLYGRYRHQREMAAVKDGKVFTCSTAAPALRRAVKFAQHPRSHTQRRAENDLDVSTIGGRPTRRHLRLGDSGRMVYLNLGVLDETGRLDETARTALPTANAYSRFGDIYLTPRMSARSACQVGHRSGTEVLTQTCGADKTVFGKIYVAGVRLASKP